MGTAITNRPNIEIPAPPGFSAGQSFQHRPRGDVFLSRTRSDTPASEVDVDSAPQDEPQTNLKQQIVAAFESGLASYRNSLSTVVETDSFKAEITNPEYVHEPGLGVDYRLYEFNRHCEGRPVVVYLGFGSMPDNDPGRTYVSAYAHHLNRRVVTLDPLGYGESRQTHSNRKWGLRDLAESNATALSEYGVEEVDLVGSSWGGVMAALLAVTKQEQVRKLITVATPGIGKSMLHHIGSLPVELYNYRRAANENKSVKGTEIVKPRNIGITSKYIQQLLRIKLAELPISPETFWVNYVGKNDKFARAEHHIRVGDKREEVAPGKTAMVVAEGGHFDSIDRVMVAIIANVALGLRPLAT